MKEGSWCIIGHHLAVKSGGNEYHPTAQEVYSAMDGRYVNGISCGTPSDELSGLHYSKFGTEVSVSKLSLLYSISNSTRSYSL